MGAWRQVRAQLLLLGTQPAVDEENPLRSKALVAPDVLAYCRMHGLFGLGWVPVPEAEGDDAESVSEAIEGGARRAAKRAKAEQDMSPGWTTWLIVLGMQTSGVDLLIMAAFLGDIRFSSSRPPFAAALL